MSKPIIPISEYERIVAMYANGKSMCEIASEYNTDHTVIKRVLLKNDVQLRDHSHKKRKYTIDESYFNCIDSPNKAYILGLLYADGCNYTKNNLVKITLQEKDKDILLKINTAIGSNRPLYFSALSKKNSNHQDAYSLEFANKAISSRLAELGVIPNKSLVLEFPQWLPAYLYRDFIRGYFDGDGHIGKHISIASSTSFCNSVSAYLDCNLSICAHVVNPKNCSPSTSVLYITKRKDIEAFLNFIYYDNAELYLQRKYDLYKNYVRG